MATRRTATATATTTTATATASTTPIVSWASGTGAADSGNYKKIQNQQRASTLNPVTRHFEFLGPHLTPLVIAGLIATPPILTALITSTKTAPTLSEGIIELVFNNANFSYDNIISLVSHAPSYAILLSWHAFHVMTYLLMPAPIATGTLLRNGEKLKYPISAFRVFLLTIALLSALYCLAGTEPFIYICNHIPQILSASIVVSCLYSIGLYIMSCGSGLRAEGGNSGYVMYDFFIGRELNPRIFGVDLKYLCELRPGLIGWGILNLCYAMKQGIYHAPLGSHWIHGVSTSMWLVNLFQGYYIFDALWNEEAILTTMDITTDGFGFMLNYGDLVWVPFTYSLQARYLSIYPNALTTTTAAAFLLLNLTGLYIFRSSNSEKNTFRSSFTNTSNTPTTSADKPKYKYITTKTGSKLLISGWWGCARHINYTGDWIMALSWCLPTGFNSILPYFYVIYFGILLVHREMRDEEKCRKKYGADWESYCSIVPYRFLPYVY